jgi:hypothetical protein
MAVLCKACRREEISKAFRRKSACLVKVPDASIVEERESKFSGGQKCFLRTSIATRRECEIDQGRRDGERILTVSDIVMEFKARHCFHLLPRRRAYAV